MAFGVDSGQLLDVAGLMLGDVIGRSLVGRAGSECRPETAE
jgi:hypothetical protein